MNKNIHGKKFGLKHIIGLVLSLALVSASVGYYVRANYYTLNDHSWIQVEIIPQNAKVGVNQSQTFHAIIYNGTVPYEITWYCNNTFIGKTNPITFIPFPQQGNMTTVTVQIADSLGNFGWATTTVYDPAVINVYLDDLPAGHTYTVKTDGTNVWSVRRDGFKRLEGTNTRTVVQDAVDACGDFDSVYMQKGTYPTLTSSISIYNKAYFTFICDGTLKSPSSDYALKIDGSSYVNNHNNIIRVAKVDGQTRAGHGILLQNSWKNKIRDTQIYECNKGIVISNSLDWSERNILDNVSFFNCLTAFTTEMSGTGTNSFIFMSFKDVQIDMEQNGAVGIKFVNTHQYQLSELQVIIGMHGPNEVGILFDGDCGGVTTHAHLEAANVGIPGSIGIEYSATKLYRDILISPHFTQNWTGATKIQGNVQYTCIEPPNTYEQVVSEGATKVSFNHNCLIQPFRSGITCVPYSTSTNWLTTWTVSNLNSTGIDITFGTAAPANAKVGVTIRIDAWSQQTG